MKMCFLIQPWENLQQVGELLKCLVLVSLMCACCVTHTSADNSEQFKQYLDKCMNE